jgi:hypothetical protein
VDVPGFRDLLQPRPGGVALAEGEAVHPIAGPVAAQEELGEDGDVDAALADRGVDPIEIVVDAAERRGQLGEERAHLQ